MEYNAHSECNNGVRLFIRCTYIPYTIWECLIFYYCNGVALAIKSNCCNAEQWVCRDGPHVLYALAGTKLFVLCFCWKGMGHRIMGLHSKSYLLIVRNYKQTFYSIGCYYLVLQYLQLSQLSWCIKVSWAAGVAAKVMKITLFGCSSINACSMYRLSIVPPHLCISQ